MHLVVDAVAVQEGSAAIVVEHLLRGWTALGAGDRLTVLSGPEGAAFRLPEGVAEVRLSSRLPGAASRAWLRSGAPRLAVRRLQADAVLAAVPASGVIGYGALRRGLLLYDLRHELRPHQFSWRQRAARRASWAWTMHRSDRIYTISHRTLSDLRDRHPRLAVRAVPAPLGADHVDAWPPPRPAEPPYALAFGHFANKNAEAVVEAWARFCERHPGWQLRLVGMGTADRRSASELVARFGLQERVELMPWLDDPAFQACFAGASVVLFPSDFEGFGLPAVEAMRLGIPVVISADPALAEVTGGHAVTAASVAPDELSGAIRAAITLTQEQLAAARRHTDTMSWRGTAATIRASLLEDDQTEADRQR